MNTGHNFNRPIGPGHARPPAQFDPTYEPAKTMSSSEQLDRIEHILSRVEL